jgi:hypothetical protein
VAVKKRAVVMVAAARFHPSIIQLEIPNMSTSKKGPNLHVVPSKARPGKFVVKAAGVRSPVTKPASQTRSVEKAIPMAKKNRSEVVIHRPDGTIRDSDSYRNDPRRSRDRKH